MTERLKQAGEMLYGARWRSDMARELGRSDRTVRRWAVAADDTVPPAVWATLRKRLGEKAAGARALQQKLKAL